MLLSIPLMIVPLLAYNAVAFTRGDIWSNVVFEFVMVRGASFIVTAGGLLLLVTLVLLFFEILKATRIGSGSIVDHLTSTLVFIAALVELLLVESAATETFFLFTVIALIDVIAGYSITIRTARRDISLDQTAL